MELRESGIRLSDGAEYTFEMKVKCSVKTSDRPALYRYMASENADALMRRFIILDLGKDSKKLSAQVKYLLAKMLPQHEISVKVGSAPDDVRVAVETLLREAGLLPSITITETQQLPGASMAAWVRKQLRLGKTVPEFFNVFAPLRAKLVGADLPAETEDEEETPL